MARVKVCLKNFKSESMRGETEKTAEYQARSNCKLSLITGD